MSAAAPLLRLAHISKQFGALRVLDDVSFDIQPGETVGLIGPNGAGKTSLFNVISGLLAPSTGQLWMDGRNLKQSGPVQRTRLGMVRSFQTSRIFPELSILDNIALGMRAGGPGAYAWWKGGQHHQASLAQADALLSGTVFAGRGRQQAAGLSYGEQRILDVLIALAQRPKLLLLDEPTAGLSGSEAQTVIALVQSQHAQCAILLISHDIDIVFAVSDRIAVLSLGQLLTIDQPAAVRTHPAAIRAYLGDLASP
ncbi:ABC transporter ATP-binding protein [Pusillimonas sp. SM2304]|uniref:ABC transporter ATP-binding protein n=1 Tax=Pusillimonas sp. SM2304 TaxID=3073241 RepID=UPI00287533A8|nr:ABC transporter ATP-binding protein [Pusillimonas sp. SM2304]MDS1138862.1 ABC transporter ATP-binding protein [Pusillimonas sp. SM2304]